MTKIQAKRLEELKRRYMAEGYKMAIRNSKKVVNEGYDPNSETEKRYREIRSRQDKGYKMISNLFTSMDEIIDAFDADYNPLKVKLLKKLRKLLGDCVDHL